MSDSGNPASAKGAPSGTASAAEPPASVPPPASSVDVRDPRTLRALSHPLRNKILGLLRLEGPSTATLLGYRLGESSGATSYHLRQLAAYGFVEDVPAEDSGGSGRERWWRALHRSTHWDTEDFLDDPAAREVVDEMLLAQIDSRRRMLTAYFEQRGALGRDWQSAASLNDYVLRLGPDDTRALAAELNEVLARWRNRTPDVPTPETEIVSVTLDVLPLKEYPL
jgi:DNA-binding transcriptional ArsR family regulator